jgi:hypothetical protein
MQEPESAPAPTAAAPAAATDNPGQADVVTGKEGGGSLLTGLAVDAAEPQDPAASSTPADSQAAPDGQTQAAPASAKQAPELPGFSAAATKALKADPRFATLVGKFKSFDDMATAHMELESKLGNHVEIPTEKSTPEERAAFYKKLGVPDTADQYALEQMDLPPGLAYNAEVEGKFREKAIELHLDPSQAAGIYGWANQLAVDAHVAAEADRKREMTETVAALRKEFGSATQAELASVNRFVKEMGANIPGLAADLEATSFGNKGSAIRLFARIAKDYANHRLASGEGGVGASPDSPAQTLFGSKS